MNKKLAGIFLAALGIASSSAWAELVVGLTTAPASQSLLTFTSENPGEILSAVAITGLQPGEQVLGIDARPSTGDLYALTNGGRLYIIDPTTGVASTPVTLSADPSDISAPFTALDGSRFGIDFNPAADRLRVVSDTDQNLRIDPATGAVVTDAPLAYMAGDPSFGMNPRIVAAAYTNNDTDVVTPTTLYVLEQELYNTKTLPDGTTLDALSLVRQGGPDASPSPNLGQLTTIGAFGRDGATIAGFDVGPSGKAFVGVKLIPEGGTEDDVFFAIVKVLLAPDPADPVGQPAGKDESQGYIGGGKLAIQDLAVISSVQFDTPLLAVREGMVTATLTVSRHGGSATTATVDYSTISRSAIAGQDYLTARGTVTFNPGEVLKTIDIMLPSDALPEADEEFEVFLFNAQGVTLGGAAVATIRISANDFTDATGPEIAHFGLTGPSRGITGAVIKFNEDLDTASAENLANYRFVGIDRDGAKQPVTFTDAAYDPNTRCVRLTATPFVQTNLKRFTFAARGKAPDGIKDTAGNFLDGNGNGTGGDNAVLKFAVLSGTEITIKDTDGDRATITIEGGGSIDASTLLGKTRRTQFWILDPIALRSTLRGAVRPRGNGIVVIAEIIGLDKKEFTPLLSNPAFRVNTLTFSSNATGL